MLRTMVAPVQCKLDLRCFLHLGASCSSSSGVSPSVVAPVSVGTCLILLAMPLWTSSATSGRGGGWCPLVPGPLPGERGESTGSRSNLSLPLASLIGEVCNNVDQSIQLSGEVILHGHWYIFVTQLMHCERSSQSFTACPLGSFRKGGRSHTF